MSDNRRDFVRTAAVTLAASSAQRILGANDKVNLVVVGIGGRGMDHLKNYSTVEGFRIAGVCDVNQAGRERGQALVQQLGGEKPKEYKDMRDVFADKTIDAVSIATPNHWHALSAIWACQAGKDVYVEKPASHNVFEGQQMLAAARKYNRIVQVGSQSRSMPHKIEAVKMVHDGIIGKVHTAKGLCYKRRLSIGRKPNQPTPPGVDWDQFLGPAPMRPFNELRFKYNWHWFWDTGNGDIGNQGVHEMDVARWGLNRELPQSVYSFGGKMVYDDDQETPNQQFAIFDYGDAQLQFEVRGLISNDEGVKFAGQHTIGVNFYGSDGYMTVDDFGYRVFKGDKHEKIKEFSLEQKDRFNTSQHMQNFLKAVRSRNHKDASADIEIGATSAALGHLANISYRVNRKLNFDAKSQKFQNDAEANKMLTREYRKPYVVPEKV
jgi:predicted dehydrogenase